MINTEYKHSDITQRIIKCCYNVHNIIGCGFQEVIYQRALAIELADEGLAFLRELEMPLYYKDNHIGTRRVDFLVEEKVLLELKATVELNDLQLAQGINYLEVFKLEVGLLINFGTPKLGIRRLMKNEEQLKKGNQIGYKEYKDNK
jgi:GxxExxY protein